ncbi:hypothetical protein [Virgibacillus salarius]|uniref:hypothetical protein n=1 Tax=Virgibacillus salarius TaxID=447199 RepID=UPI001FE3B42D|nr:hypothetical protein [Virgibacillus salarius]
MKVFKRRGKRIREKDASLVFQFVFLRLFGTWLLFFTPFHISFLLSAEWQLKEFQNHFISIYGLVTLLISLVMTVVCAVVYNRL